ncbi:4Fe-4S dicluster domain-containing protein [Natrarchaeobius oligotrophus]|uniref:Dehydrogenase n=1 Tax=Natrarchaeobius chitinivorans TaxID=1679083 RepID=A0A3N6PHE6_NATCH|nr:4Fe-4S dicluster domain-containing protein [Natrarchaeobius chitinivorans]RQH00010.1 dehydrogenase [Natrarchaeobius chitinivorans]
MAEVYNWQIGREMEFPYAESRPDRQWGAVFDINKCIACQTCTLSCKTTWTHGEGQEHMFWNNVETKPYGSHPVGWDVEILEMLDYQEWGSDGVYEGDTIFEANDVDWEDMLVDDDPQNFHGEEIDGYRPDAEDWAYPNLGEDEPAGEAIEADTHIRENPHPMWFFYLPRICNHCTFAACAGGCPVQAAYKRSQDGIVLIDQESCQALQECVRACPYGKSVYNPAESVSQKCVGCYPKIEEGLVPQCFENCLGKLRQHGWINPPDEYDSSNPVDYLVHDVEVALPLYPQLGLEPNVYYVPPINVPTDYLFQMFGPGVEDAVETYRAAMRGDEEYRKLRGLLHLMGSTEWRIEAFEVTDEEAVGYDGSGSTVARVPMEEPQYERDSYDERNDVYRLDVT